MTNDKLSLGVNVDHVATLRQARGTSYPDPVEAARAAEGAGADSITMHLREDRRHIQDHDVRRLCSVMTTRLNLEMAATPEMLELALAIRPADCCLVPERREELTTEGGLDVAGNAAELEAACARLAGSGIRVSLFVDPEPAQLEAAARAGAPVVELHTGAYAEAIGTEREEALARIIAAARRGTELGLTVHAGHGLNYDNVGPVAAIGEIVELNIGHAIVARSVFSGFAQAVAEMKRLMHGARAR